MTPADLRAEAEKVVLEIVPLCYICGEDQQKQGFCSRPHKPYLEQRAKITDALLRFAQRYGARERLEGQATAFEEAAAMEYPFGHRQFDPWCEMRLRAGEARAELAALERGEEARQPEDHDYLSTYCYHGNHADCRLTCKTCGASCRCVCHAAMKRGEEAG